MANQTSVTYSGRSLLWGRMKSLMTEPVYIGWGSGTVTGSAQSDVNLFAAAAEARATGVSSLLGTGQLADTYRVTGMLTATGARTITEVALFDSPTVTPVSPLNNTVTSASQTVFNTFGSIMSAGGNYYAQVANECVLVTGGQGTTTVTVARAQLGSTAAASYPGGAVVYLTPGGDGGAHVNAGFGGQTGTIGAAQGGNMFLHGDFGQIVLATNDSITFTITAQLTGT